MNGVLIWMVLLALHGYANDQQRSTMSGYYCGMWAETTWEYNFESDGVFSFKSNGHFGNTRSKGVYRISGDTLVLNSIGQYAKRSPGVYVFKNDSFLIDGDSCMIDIDTGYDYCKTHYKSMKTGNGEKKVYYIDVSRERMTER